MCCNILIVWRHVRTFAAIVFTIVSLHGLQVFPNEIMYAHYIDVGQADATLLEFPCGAVLIDAGSQDDAHTDALIDYLTSFFQRRSDLNNTLNTIIITHNHIDHTRALRKVAETFIVQNYIDNGQLTGPGTGKPNWIRTATNTDGSAINVREVPDSEITAIVDKSGLTDNAIDPLQCSQCDPVIRILSGRLDTNPGWSDHEFKNKNNHSLVVRIDFDRASFLFTGDMEEQAIETLIDWYSGTDMLDVDVYQVGHHGSYNGTNGSLLNAMSPDMAVISCGQWDFGLNSNSLFTTHRFGHPRRVILDLLGDHIRKRRSSPVNIRAAESSRVFDWYSVRRKIYATPWDGTVKVRAPESAVYRVTRNN